MQTKKRLSEEIAKDIRVTARKRLRRYKYGWHRGCYLFVFSMTGGEESNSYQSDKTDLYLEAINRNVSITNLTTKQICKKVMETIPSVMWQRDNLRRQFLLSKNPKWRLALGVIHSYKSYGYKSINYSLRRGEEEEANINELIDQLIPLDKDIYVFRLATMTKQGLGEKIYRQQHTINKPFVSKGYLSTSINSGNAK